MGEFRVTASFNEEYLIQADSVIEAEEKVRLEHYVNAKELAGRLLVTAEDCYDTSEAAYQRLLAKVRCTSNHFCSNTLAGLSPDSRVDFLMAQLDYLGIGGYTRQQVERLVKENLRRLYSNE
jgi:hypothetical protein